MIRPYRVRASQGSTHRFFKLIFAGIPIAGQNLFGLSHGNFNDIGVHLISRQQNNTADLAQGNPRTRVFVQGKDILDDNEVGLFINQQFMDPGVDFLQPGGSGRLLMRSDHAVCKIDDLPSVTGNNTDTGGCQSWVNTDELDCQFCNIGVPENAG